MWFYFIHLIFSKSCQLHEESMESKKRENKSLMMMMMSIEHKVRGATDIQSFVLNPNFQSLVS